MSDPIANNEQLRQYVEQYEQLANEKKDISDQMSDLMASAKSDGFDTKAIRRIIRIRQDLDKHRQEDEILELYMTALGLVQ